MENTKIEWADHTFNPWWGCMKVSAGCKNCYAETFAHRYHQGLWGPGSSRKIAGTNYWTNLVRWNLKAYKDKRKALVFVGSMCDIFEGHPDTLEPLKRFFAQVMECKDLIFLLVTKHPENILRLCPPEWLWKNQWPENVWMGSSVEDQATADTRIPQLVEVPAKVRFLSCEPLLGPVDFLGKRNLVCDETGICICPKCYPQIHWVIAGGESGHGARPMHPDWARSLRDQCQCAGIPFFFKQWGEYNHYGNKVGKKAAGAKFDGVEHKNWPAV